MKSRNLKIEATGDFFKRQVLPKIRLSGKWLAEAGFQPGNRVAVEIGEQGTLVLRFVPQPVP
jgi:hypothetical protein